MATIPTPVPAPRVHVDSPQLVRGLGAWASTSLVVGTMIGTGIYLKPAEIAREAGSVEWALVAWVAGALLTLLGALMYLELGTMMPEAGADYEYLKRGLGPLWGFLYGWKGTIVQGPASTAALAAGMALFAQAIWPGLEEPVLVAGRIAIDGRELLALASVGVVCAINLLPVRRVGQAQVVLTAIKVAVLAAVIGVGLSYRGPGPASAALPAPPSFGGVMAAITGSLWAFSGWQTLLRVGSEVRDPGRTLPVAMIGGFGVTAILFLLINLACFSVLGFDAVAGSDHVASDMLDRATGGGLAVWFTAAMAVSAFGSMNAAMLGHSRVSYAMARDGLLPGRLDAVSEGNRAPRAAVIYTAVVAMVLVVTGTFEDLTALFVFTSWLFHVLGGMALIRLRRVEPDTPRPVRAWGYPVVPALFILVSATLTVSIAIERPVRSLLGVALIVVGVPLFRRWSAPSRGAMQ